MTGGELSCCEAGHLHELALLKSGWPRSARRVGFVAAHVYSACVRCRSCGACKQQLALACRHCDDAVRHQCTNSVWRVAKCARGAYDGSPQSRRCRVCGSCLIEHSDDTGRVWLVQRHAGPVSQGCNWIARLGGRGALWRQRGIAGWAIGGQWQSSGSPVSDVWVVCGGESRYRPCLGYMRACRSHLAAIARWGGRGAPWCQARRGSRAGSAARVLRDILTRVGGLGISCSGGQYTRVFIQLCVGRLQGRKQGSGFNVKMPTPQLS